jgi:hypothetical protein
MELEQVVEEITLVRVVEEMRLVVQMVQEQPQEQAEELEVRQT